MKKRKITSICSLIVVFAIIISMINVTNVSAATTSSVKTATATAADGTTMSKTVTLTGDAVEIEFAIKGAEMQPEYPDGNLVLLIDTSGTMQFNTTDYLTPVKDAAKKFAGELLEKVPTASIAIVTYNWTSKVILEFSNDINVINSAIDSISVVDNDHRSSGTNIQDALHTADTLLSTVSSSKSAGAILLIGDGKATRSYKAASLYINPDTKDGKTTLNVMPKIDSRSETWAQNQFLIKDFDYSTVLGYSSSLTYSAKETYTAYEFPSTSTGRQIQVMRNYLPTVSEAQFIKDKGITIFTAYLHSNGNSPDDKEIKSLMENVASTEGSCKFINVKKKDYEPQLKSFVSDLKKLCETPVAAASFTASLSDCFPSYIIVSSVKTDSQSTALSVSDAVNLNLISYNTDTNTFSLSLGDINGASKNITFYGTVDTALMLEQLGSSLSDNTFTAPMNTKADLTCTKSSETETITIENEPAFDFNAYICTVITTVDSVEDTDLKASTVSYAGTSISKNVNTKYDLDESYNKEVTVFDNKTETPVEFELSENGVILFDMPATDVTVVISYTTKPVVTPEPTPSVDPEPTPSVDPEPTPSVDPEPTPSVDPEPTPSVEPEPTPSVDPEPTPSAEPEPTPSAEPEPTPSAEPEPTPIVTPEAPIQIPVLPGPVVTPTPSVTPVIENPVTETTPAVAENPAETEDVPAEETVAVEIVETPEGTADEDEPDVEIPDSDKSEEPEEILVPDSTITPQGLPKTGTQSVFFFYGLGSLCILLGSTVIVTVKKH